VRVNKMLLGTFIFSLIIYCFVFIVYWWGEGVNNLTLTLGLIIKWYLPPTNVVLGASLTLIILFSEMLKFLKYIFYSEIFLGKENKEFYEIFENISFV
jgi:hypothetical protein